MIRLPRSLRYAPTVLPFLISICIAASCHTPQETHPEQVVSEVLEHLYEGHWDAAWPLITPENQKELLERQRILAEAAGIPPTDKAKDAFLAYGLAVHAPAETAKLSSHPDRSPAQVRVTLGTGPGTTLTVYRNEGGKWQVDILSALTAVHP